MFRNENRQHSKRDKSKKSYIKKSTTHIVQSITECPKTKRKKSGKLEKSQKHYRFKHVPIAASDYVGPERLTKQVGFFTKGKISDSISRLEKTMPKEIKARVQQDLKQVLNLNNKHKNSKKYIIKRRRTSRVKSIQSSINTPHYLLHKTGFASNSWKDKLQNSVGLTSVNSILASVHVQPHESTPKQSELQIVRKVLLKKIHPCIKEANSFIFPTVSNKDKVKVKLLQIRNQLNPSTVISSQQASISSSIPPDSPHTSLDNSIKNLHQSMNKDFKLNPIFIGDSFYNRDFSNIFPPADKFTENNDLIISDVESTYAPGDVAYEDEIQPSRETSGVGSGSVTLVPSTPTSCDSSPSWKLRLSPAKFVPENPPTPTFYFRHKMF